MLTLLGTVLACIGELQPCVTRNGCMDADVQPQRVAGQRWTGRVKPTVRIGVVDLPAVQSLTAPMALHPHIRSQNGGAVLR